MRRHADDRLAEHTIVAEYGSRRLAVSLESGVSGGVPQVGYESQLDAPEVVRRFRLEIKIQQQLWIAEYWPGAMPDKRPPRHALASVVKALRALDDISGVPKEFWPTVPAPRRLKPLHDNSDPERMTITPKSGNVSRIVAASEDWSLEGCNHIVEVAGAERFLGEDCPADIVLEALNRLNRDPIDVDRLKRLVEASPVSFSQVLPSARGPYHAALMIAEHEVEAVSSGTPTDSRVMGAALTSILYSHLVRYDGYAPQLISRALNLAVEWITRQQRRPYKPLVSLAPSLFKSEGAVRLLECAPWLSWYILPSSSMPRVELSPEQFLDVLAVARPRIRHGSKGTPASIGSYVAQTEVVTFGEWLIHFDVAPAIADTIESDERFNNLAFAMQNLYHSPQDVLPTIQALYPLGLLQPLLDSRVDQLLALRRSTPDQLRVLVDRPALIAGGQVLLLNAARDRRLQVSVEGVTYRLEPFATDQPKAAAYVSELIELAAPSRLTAEIEREEVSYRTDVRVPLDESDFALAPDSTVIDHLFRGRQSQLKQLAAAMRPTASRTGCLIFGARRAGKTTLAIHACRQAVAGGVLAGYELVDLHADLPGESPESYGEELAAAIGQRFAPHGLDLVVRADPVDVLNQIDRQLTRGRSMGLVLDEFDTLLAHGGSSPLYRLATRLGSKRWQNLFVVATVQRFYRSTADLKAFEPVMCPLDLSWQDGLTYFAEPLAQPSSDHHAPVQLTRPFVTPRTYNYRIVARLGYRPYFWGLLRRKLNDRLWFDRDQYAVVPDDCIIEFIDSMVEREEPYLTLPLIPAAGLPLAERRRQDLFSDEERSVLALVAFGTSDHISMTDALNAGGSEAVLELTSRGYLDAQGQRSLRVSVPIFGEYLRRRADAFARYRR
jgi:hypothetical protein